MVVGPFAVLMGVCQVTYLVAVTTLGVRLLLRARRNRQLPEALLATHFLLATAISYVMLVAGLSFARAPHLVPAGTIPLLVGVAGLTLSVGLAGYGFTGGFEHGRFEGTWFWLFYGTFAVGAAWVMVEPLVYHRAMKRRQSFGLADPLVVNRFWLWGVGSVCRFGMVLGGAAASVLFGGVPTELEPDGVGLMLMAIALLGVGVSVSYWLTFFPTPGYVRFVERRHA